MNEKPWGDEPQPLVLTPAEAERLLGQPPYPPGFVVIEPKSVPTDNYIGAFNE